MSLSSKISYEKQSWLLYVFLILFLRFISFQHRRKLAASKLCQVRHRSCSVGTTFSCDAVSRRLVILVPELFQTSYWCWPWNPQQGGRRPTQRSRGDSNLCKVVGWIASDSRLSLTLWFFYAPWLSICVECTHSLFSRFSCFVSWLDRVVFQENCHERSRAEWTFRRRNKRLEKKKNVRLWFCHRTNGPVQL